MESKTIREIYFEWKEAKRRFVKESSLATYAVNAERHILPVFGDCQAIDGAAVQAFAFGLKGQGLSHRTVRDILLVLKMIVVYGHGRGWFGRCDWEVRLPKDDARPGLTVLTPGEQKAVMAFLKSHLTFRNLGLYICLCTGMRIGEICALKWGDIDMQRRVIRVSRTIERIYVTGGEPRRTKVVISTPKTTSSMRDIPVSAGLYSLLRPMARLVSPDCYVITNAEKPLEPRLYRRHYMQLMAGLGMPEMKFHGLRHTFATRCIESNCDYKTVSSILGHASISTTLNLYVHPDMQQKRKCIDKMMKTVMK